jgi:hypothetical protein
MRFLAHVSPFVSGVSSVRARASQFPQGLDIAVFLGFLSCRYGENGQWSKAASKHFETAAAFERASNRTRDQNVSRSLQEFALSHREMAVAGDKTAYRTLVDALSSWRESLFLL